MIKKSDGFSKLPKIRMQQKSESSQLTAIIIKFDPDFSVEDFKTKDNTYEEQQHQ